MLRQPATVPYKEKVAYVDEVIKLLDMEEYADAVVGVLGEGLNVEQRKRYVKIRHSFSLAGPLPLYVLGITHTSVPPYLSFFKSI